MESPPTATRDGAFLALALADALKLGLPDPDYISMSPEHAGGTTYSAVSFQFNDQHGRDPLPPLQAWADRFGVTVNVSTGVVHPSSTWHKFEFKHAGVLFDAYAQIEAAAPVAELVLGCPATSTDDDDNWHSCDREDGHPGSHHDTLHDGGEIAWSDAAAVLAASIASGQPVITDDAS